MASIVFKCSYCDYSISSDDTLCGEVTSCPECKKEVVVPIPGLEAGNEYGDFKLLELLGSGASGEVWLAHQQSMDRKVALKVLCPKLSSDKLFIKRFMKEARNSAKLAHPNIVTAFYAGHEKGMYYLAISYVNGATIDARLEHGAVFKEKEALETVKGIALALQYAWDEFKILHRDIKPANIIINKKGVPMLLDLGISKSLQEDSDLTMTGTVIGTPYYMSPEQAMADKEMDFRSDIYSLGATLYHMLTGKVPYNATTAMAIIMKHINEPFEPPINHNPEITEQCSQLIETMMAKQKEDRQQSWSALINDIDLVMKDLPPETPLPEGGSTIEKSTDVKRSYSKAKTVLSDSEASDQKSNRKTIPLLPICIAITIILLIVLYIFVPGSSSETKSASVDKSAVKSVVTEQSKSVSKTVEKEIPPEEIPVPEEVDEFAGVFKKVADKLDLSKNTSMAVKKNWEAIDDKEYTMYGKIVSVSGGWGKAEVHAACPDRMLYKGFNAILVTYNKDRAAKLKLGENIRFTGNVYKYKPKSTGLVILYVDNVVFPDVP